MFLSQTRGKNHKDWLYSGYGKSYSKSCYSFDSNHKSLKAYSDNTIYANEQCWRKIIFKKECLSQTKGKNHEDWLYCGFGNSYSKSCYSFDSNQITLETYLDDTIDSSKQCWSKINPKKACFSQIRGKKHED